MAQDRFLIAPISVGLQTDVRPWIVPDTAFARLNNALVHHGRVKKRFGSTYMDLSTDQRFSRLRIKIGTTRAVSGDFITPVDGTVPGTYFDEGQMFSIGTTIFTVPTTGTPVTLLTTGTATGTYNTTTGALSITGNTENPSTAVYFYPALPVMGFFNLETAAINNEPLFAFDPQFSYTYTNGTGWDLAETPITADSTWTFNPAGDNSDFFWTTNYRGPLASDNFAFTTNFVAADGIRYWDGSKWTKMTAAQLEYDNTTGQSIVTARIILPFQGRLVIFNTIETVGGVDTPFPQRVRWCQPGDPISVSGGISPWDDRVSGRGDFADIPSKQPIMSAAIFKNRVIIYCERSTYELVFTGTFDPAFVIQEINVDLGVESPFSTVIFDRSVIGIGSNGIHACNGAYVERIDDKIQDDVFKILNENNGTLRVHGIRDYKEQVVYWTMPYFASLFDLTRTYPNKVLVYNYENGTWAFNDDCITAFGYFYQPDDTAVVPALDQSVVAGNQEGYTFLCDPDETRNVGALQISDIVSAGGDDYNLNIINHNLETGDFILVENCEGNTSFNDKIYKVTEVDDDTVTITETGVAGTYSGSGTAARVSRIDILSKQYNFYESKGRNFRMNAVSFFIDITLTGQIQVDFIPDSLPSTTTIDSVILETSAYALYPGEASQKQSWHTLYPEVSGNLLQLHIYLTDTQLSDNTDDAAFDIALSDFQMHAMMFYVQPTSDRLQ